MGIASGSCSPMAAVSDPFAVAADLLDPPQWRSETADQQRAAWKTTARAEQLPPSGDWRSWYIRGGRGSGKTRTGAETFASWVLENPPGEWAIIAPTFGDARDVCTEGPRSGILKALGDAVENWNRSMGEVWVKNGSRIYIDGADDGALRIQGKNLRGAWCDEVGLWRKWDQAWNESLAFAVREAPAQIIATGTPKGNHGLVKQLLADPNTVSTKMSTVDNADNLDARALADMERRYGGTRLGRQELLGEVLDDVEGALWNGEMITAALLEGDPPEHYDRIVVGVDPAGGGRSLTGIVAAARKGDHAYILSDDSGAYSPDAWGKRVVAVYHRVEADRIVAERNFGADMVEHIIRQTDNSVSLKTVTARKGKIIRAEPIAALYEQGRVHHVRPFPELEEQMTTYVPGESDSPDRMDAMVWALTDLMLGKTRPLVGPVSVTGQSSWRG